MSGDGIRIGGEETGNRLVLAPLAGYTNAVFRKMCFDLGAGLTFTEMVSAKGLCYGSEKTASLLALPEGDCGIPAVQLFGHEPEYIRRAVQSEAIAPFRLIDINMGCPVPKIFKNGDGCALLSDFSLASEVIKAAKSGGRPVSVKFRIGLSEDSLVAADFARMCEDSGADMITVHGRVRTRMYSGDVDFSQIAAAKNAVSIPVIANGGVFSKEDAERLMGETGADGVMIARGAMCSPWIFADITGRRYDRRELVLRQIDDTRDAYGERFACVYMRKMAAFYIKGMRGASDVKKALFSAGSTEEVKEIVRSLPWDGVVPAETR